MSTIVTQLDQRTAHSYERTEDLYQLDLMGRYLSAELQPDAACWTRSVETDAQHAERDLAFLRVALYLGEK
jgi:hypothetical protein